MLVFVRRTKQRWNKVNDYLGNVTKTVDSVRYGDLTKKIEALDILDSENLSESLNRMIETLHDREKMINEYQKELIQQNKILETILNSLSDGLIITDENDVILRITTKVSEWFEVDGEKIIGKKLQDFVHIRRKKPVPLLHNDEVFVLTDKSSNFNAETVELNLDDNKQRYIVILRNVTDQKELETLKEDFVATLTHDLKVPIIAETNMLELFLNGTFGKITEKQAVALRNMQNSVNELLDLVQIVLDTYKVKDGKITLYKESIMLNSFINEVVAETEPLTLKTGNKIVFKEVRDIRVVADRCQLKRVVKNLIQNALSYGKPKTPIEITIGEIPNFATIKVKDHGVGISKDDINKIFNRYYSAAKKFRKIGTGLGLYLALQITKAHGGDLTVESVEGEFTEFCIKIPVDYERSFI